MSAERPGEGARSDPAQDVHPAAVAEDDERAERDADFPEQVEDEADLPDDAAPLPVEEEEAEGGESLSPPPVEDAEEAEGPETPPDRVDPSERGEQAMPPPADEPEAERPDPATRASPPEGERAQEADPSMRPSVPQDEEEPEAAADLPAEEAESDPEERTDQPAKAEETGLPHLESVELEERADEAAALDAEDARPPKAEGVAELPIQEEEEEQAQPDHRPDDLRLKEQADELWTTERLGALRRASDEAMTVSDRDRDLAEHIAELTRLQDRTSPSDVEGHSAAENQVHVEETQLAEKRLEDHHSAQVSALRAVHYGGERLQGSNDTFREIVDQLFEQERVGLDDDVHKLLHEQLRVELVLQRAGDDEKLREALWIAAEKPGKDDASPQARALRSAFDDALETKLRGDEALRTAFERANVHPRAADTTREFMKRLGAEALDRPPASEAGRNRAIRTADDQARNAEAFSAERDALLRQQKVEFIDQYDAAYRNVFDKNPGLASEDQQDQILQAIRTLRAQVESEDRRRRR